MSSREIAKADVERISKTVQTDSNGLVYNFDTKAQCFLGTDAKGVEWIMGVDSSVEGYWYNCPVSQGFNSKGYEQFCKTPHFVFKFQHGEKLTCRKCKQESTVQLVLPVPPIITLNE